ncbi:peptidyl-tRNA hydrolase, PTH1 family [Allopseudospirillum japonicum]|uniref:Peptidyl-tRNA hydrolase n=1 Tax=Allopseudospirillum japonicum TaxID=64971 RepID=A0A1H6QBH6_9GAMM|nr:aminoacyl-tRNA hydrolase [Allopseudospirillum japonicum]SEI39206.1 peptidyl-tRNA hydrolase, PTH1 family [Allopseudospirillum japonicum]
MSVAIKAIIGLGNPGAEYAATRHNAGAWFVENLARQSGVSLSPHKNFYGLYAKIILDGQEVHLLNPTTFMNRSGQAVAALMKFYKLPLASLLVAHDELDLAPGIARFKQAGGHGGHNGLRDIIAHLANQKDFYRLRIGIGHPGSSDKVTGHVLKRAPASEQTLIEQALAASHQALPWVLKGQWTQAMNQLHAFKAQS